MATTMGWTANTESLCDAQAEVLTTATELDLDIKVGLAYHQSSVSRAVADVFFYLGAAPIVKCLSTYRPNVGITSLVADVSLFLAPMIYELGWDWDSYHMLAQCAMADHFLKGGCQLTWGFLILPDDQHEDISFKDLLDTPLPFAEVGDNDTIILAKTEDSGGVLNSLTCAEQLLYEVGNPSSYTTPGVIIDFQQVVLNQYQKKARFAAMEQILPVKIYLQNCCC